MLVETVVLLRAGLCVRRASVTEGSARPVAGCADSLHPPQLPDGRVVHWNTGERAGIDNLLVMVVVMARRILEARRRRRRRRLVIRELWARARADGVQDLGPCCHGRVDRGDDGEAQHAEAWGGGFDGAFVAGLLLC